MHYGVLLFVFYLKSFVFRWNLTIKALLEVVLILLSQPWIAGSFFQTSNLVSPHLAHIECHVPSLGTLLDRKDWLWAFVVER